MIQLIGNPTGSGRGGLYFPGVGVLRTPDN